MQLVIDIPKGIYKTLCKYPTIDIVRQTVINGTPLEKHDEEVIKETVESIWGKPPYTEVLDKIKAEIEMYEADCRFQGGTDECEKCNSNVFGSVYQIIDKYRK